MFIFNRKGSVMVSVLMVVAVLTILGIGLSAVALNDRRQTARQEGKNEAYYIARGGAEAVGAYLIKNPEAAQEIIAKGQDEVVLENGVKFVVQVTKAANGQLRVESTGYSGKYSDRVTLSLEYDPQKALAEQNPILDMAVFSQNLLNLNGAVKGSTTGHKGSIGTNATGSGSIVLLPQAEIFGDVIGGSGGDMNSILVGKGTIHGDVRTFGAERNYPLPVFPVFPTDLNYNGDLVVRSTPDVIYTDGEYNRISISGELKISTEGPEDIRRIVVNSLEMGNSSKITLLGEGTLILYVKTKFDMKQAATINLGNDPNKIIVYYKGTDEIKNHNDSKLCGCLYAEIADIDVSNGGDIMGSIFTGGAKVDLKNSSYVRVIYAPNALVTLHNSGNVDGAIVCKEFFSKNGSTVRYDEVISGVWGIIPDIYFEPVEVETPGYLKGFWS